MINKEQYGSLRSTIDSVKEGRMKDDVAYFKKKKVLKRAVVKHTGQGGFVSKVKEIIKALPEIRKNVKDVKKNEKSTEKMYRQYAQTDSLRRILKKHPTWNISEKEQAGMMQDPEHPELFSEYVSSLKDVKKKSKNKQQFRKMGSDIN